MKHLLIVCAAMLCMAGIAFGQGVNTADLVGECQEQYIVWTPDPEDSRAQNGTITDIGYALCLLKDPFAHANYEFDDMLSWALDNAQKSSDPNAVLAKYGASVKEVEETLDKMLIKQVQRDYGQFYSDLKKYGPDDPDLGWTIGNLFLDYGQALKEIPPGISYGEIYENATEVEFATLDQKLGFDSPTAIGAALLCAAGHPLLGEVVGPVVAECKLDQLPAPTWPEFGHWCSVEHIDDCQ